MIQKVFAFSCYVVYHRWAASVSWPVKVTRIQQLPLNPSENKLIHVRRINSYVTFQLNNMIMNIVRTYIFNVAERSQEIFGIASCATNFW